MQFEHKQKALTLMNTTVNVSLSDLPHIPCVVACVEVCHSVVPLPFLSLSGVDVDTWALWDTPSADSTLYFSSS